MYQWPVHYSFIVMYMFVLLLYVCVCVCVCVRACVRACDPEKIVNSHLHKIRAIIMYMVIQSKSMQYCKIQIINIILNPDLRIFSNLCYSSRIK